MKEREKSVDIKILQTHRNTDTQTHTHTDSLTSAILEPSIFVIDG